MEDVNRQNHNDSQKRHEYPGRSGENEPSHNQSPLREGESGYRKALCRISLQQMITRPLLQNYNRREVSGNIDVYTYIYIYYIIQVARGDVLRGASQGAQSLQHGNRHINTSLCTYVCLLPPSLFTWNVFHHVRLFLQPLQYLNNILCVVTYLFSSFSFSLFLTMVAFFASMSVVAPNETIIGLR
ncbi:hypothetical protein Tb927.4.4390 [Trypanosoma brucei brucei TREU927]|uniref:T. brucei spp.-specific protein n=2 Tax=Trypanosoma brucei TaxID=5691 RepID=Q57Y43_TRYB2|nr:hypothetical protein Tb927.4.4390 [Trypanosoma brucei brucei TREU927]AAX69476.1 hypothetical protein Tb927.4.4390 [Trypanosoma brucei]AAX80066.1 hypothetical protein Tb04.30K5.1080 [Trypanosoma brucei]AAZ11030.1 hypothetical protein Tb927.4.4390 [Trypanosoma brucei brucei TREU927]